MQLRHAAWRRWRRQRRPRRPRPQQLQRLNLVAPGLRTGNRALQRRALDSPPQRGRLRSASPPPRAATSDPGYNVRCQDPAAGATDCLPRGATPPLNRLALAGCNHAERTAVDAEKRNISIKDGASVLDWAHEPVPAAGRAANRLPSMPRPRWDPVPGVGLATGMLNHLRKNWDGGGGSQSATGMSTYTAAAPACLQVGCAF